MTSILSDALFDHGANRSLQQEAPCNASPQTRYRTMLGGAMGNKTADIHVAPSNLSSYSHNRARTFGDFPSLTSIPSSFVSDNNQNHSLGTKRDLIHWTVVKEDDAKRGFRMFDGILMSVKDVSSEELFLERMKIAYSAYDAYVSGLVNKSPLEITRGLVKAVSACLTKYFSTQSMLRTNRPFIAKVLNLDSPDMFCTHSDFMHSFMFTNASPEDDAIISLAEKVYAENNFDVCEDTMHDQSMGNNSNNNSTFADQIFDFGMRIAERSVVGGTNASSEQGGNFTTLSDELLFQQRKDGGGKTMDGGTTAMLIVVTDFEALHNYVAYVLYLTPTQLTRRYSVDFNCLQRPKSKANLDCCGAREARKRKRDNSKVVIAAVIEKKRREKIDTMAERSAACEATLQQRATQTLRRSNDLLCHVLLMLFDKCLSGLIDKGFENLNSRRGYAVNSAKEIGTATIYTGIIDTVGEISAHVEGYTFENIVKNAADSAKENDKTKPHLRFSFPLTSIVTEVSGSGSNNTGSGLGNESE